MKYMLIYSGDQTSDDLVEDASQPAYREACDGWHDDMVRQGIVLQTAGLLPPSDATTLRVREGKTLLTDGPFAETREQMGGFSLVECKDLDHAIEVAASHPWSKIGQIEIRPMREP